MLEKSVAGFNNRSHLDYDPITCVEPWDAHVVKSHVGTVPPQRAPVVSAIRMPIC